MRRSKTKQQRPLVEIKKPLRARVYRAKFRPLETTKFLDVKALRKARKATLEVGTVDVAGTSVAIAADIRNGKIVALKPVTCKGCDAKPSMQGRRKINRAALRKTMQLAGAALKKRGVTPPPMPMPIRVSARLGFEIPLGPIIIIIGPDGVDICFQIWIGNRLCWWCLFSPNGCIDFGPPIIR